MKRSITDSKKSHGRLVEEILAAMLTCLSFYFSKDKCYPDEETKLMNASNPSWKLFKGYLPRISKILGFFFGSSVPMCVNLHKLHILQGVSKISIS